MDFNSSVEGTKIYALDKTNFKLSVGNVLSRTLPTVKVGTIQQVIDITVDFGDTKKVFTKVPVNADSAKDGDIVIACDKEKLTSVINSMVETAKSELGKMSFYERIISEAPNMLCEVNPKYAEEEKKNKVIEGLIKRQDATDAKLDAILSMLRESTDAKKSKQDKQ